VQCRIPVHEHLDIFVNCFDFVCRANGCCDRFVVVRAGLGRITVNRVRVALLYGENGEGVRNLCVLVWRKVIGCVSVSILLNCSDL
jgi:hypothetical protein